MFLCRFIAEFAGILQGLVTLKTFGMKIQFFEQKVLNKLGRPTYFSKAF
jgi:hypothetical protein